MIAFVAEAGYFALFSGESPLHQDAKILLWDWKVDQIAKFNTPALTDILPIEFKTRELTDYRITIHLDMDKTVLTIILLGNFVEDLKHDEQCVILLIKFRFLDIINDILKIKKFNDTKNVKECL